MSTVVRYKPEVKKLQEAISVLIPKNGDIFNSPHSDTITELCEKIKGYKLKPSNRQYISRYEELNKQLYERAMDWFNRGYWNSAIYKKLAIVDIIKHSPALHRYIFTEYLSKKLSGEKSPIEMTLFKEYSYTQVYLVKLAVIKNPHYKHITGPSDLDIREKYVGKYKGRMIYGNLCESPAGAKRSLENIVAKLVGDSISK